MLDFKYVMPSGKNAGKTARDVFHSSYVVQASGCWEWAKKKFKNGYGCFGYQGRYLLAHRVSYEEYYGEEPLDMLVMHSCDNPSCVNPQHLSLGTHSDNAKDMINKGRGNSLRGLRNPRCKLSDDDIKSIISRRNSGELCRHLALEFGVSGKTISVVSRGVQRPQEV